MLSSFLTFLYVLALVQTGRCDPRVNNIEICGEETTTSNYWGDDSDGDMEEPLNDVVPPQSDGMDDFVRKAILNCQSGSCYLDQKTTSCISAKIVQSVCLKTTARDTANEAMDFVGSCLALNAKTILKAQFDAATLCLKSVGSDFSKMQTSLGAVIISGFQGPYNTAKAAATQYMQQNPSATCADQNVQAAIRDAFAQYLNSNTVNDFNNGFANTLSCDEAECFVDYFFGILNLEPLGALMNQKKQCGFNKDKKDDDK